MVKDLNNNPENPLEPEHIGDTPENNELRQKLQQEKEEALRLSKLSKAELLHELEKHDIHAEKEKAQDFMRQTDFPEMRPESNNSPEHQRLQDMFREIQTDHVEYPFFRRVFPNFIRVCEDSRLLQNLPVDIVALVTGMAESIISVAILTGHIALDTLKFAWSPVQTYRDTKTAYKD